MALPAIDALARLAREEQVDVAVGPHSRAVVEERRTIAQAVAVPDIPRIMDAMRLAKIAAEYDAVALLDRSRILHLSLRLARSATSIRDVQNAHLQHETDVYLDVARTLGARPQTTIPQLDFSPTTRAKAATFLEHIPANFITVHPGGAENPGARMPDKRWPVECYAALCDWASQHDLAVVATGGSGDAPTIRRLQDAMGSSASIVSLAGQASLMESAYIAARGRLYVGGDTGMSHLAAASGVPSIAIFGPTNPARYGPRGPRVRILAPPDSYEVEDRDLRRNVSDSARLPRTDQISVQQVIDEAAELLNEMSGRCQAS